MPSLTRLHYGLLATLVSAIWGFNYVVVKSVLVNLSSLEALTIRFLLLSVVVIPFFRRPPVPIRILAKFILIFTIIHLGGMYYALENGLSVSHTSVFVQVGVPSLMLMSAYLYREQLTFFNFVGIALSLSGVAYILNVQHLNPSYILNYAAITISGIFWGAYSLLLKQVPKNTHYVSLIAWIGLCSLPFTWGAMYWVEGVSLVDAIGKVSPFTLLGLFYMTFISSLTGHSLWGYLLSKTSGSFLAPFFVLVPVFGICGGIFFLNEPVTRRFLAGAFIVLVGLYLSIRKARQI